MSASGSSDRYRLIEAVYQRAIELPVEQRPGFLTSECGPDAALRSEVEGLLEHYSAAPPGFLERPAHALLLPEEDAALPQRIGNYQVLRLLGTGGMGVVYEAQQESPHRAVALKLIRFGFTTNEALRRFRQEAELLGQLEHPGIARIYEAGVARVDAPGWDQAQQPFLAMELVRGEPLSAYARQKRPDLRTRLELLASICDVVQFAHQKGVIHRDLKPGNILVVEEGIKRFRDSGIEEKQAVLPTLIPQSLNPLIPQPKILDFGVARAVHTDLQTLTRHTDTGQLLGTLPYMSPEQLAGDPRAVDTRSDIYALGVIAYELLTEQMPLDVAGRPLPQAIRVLAEHEPRRAGALRSDLRGDLEAILAKALEKNPARRYAAAAELAADFRRYLRHEPVTARPPRVLYQLGKFARRNRALVLGAGLALLALFVGITGTAIFAWREKQQAERARTQAARAEATVRFLRDMLASVDPLAARGRDVTVRTMLDEAARKIESGELAAQPEVEAALRNTIGETYNHLGLYREARPHLEAALRTLRTLPESPSEGMVHSLNMLSYAASGLGNYAEAERFDREALDLARRLFGPAHPRVARTMGDLGVTVGEAGRWDEAEQLHRQALALWRTLPAAQPQEVAQGLSNLGNVLHERGHYEEAEPFLREALALRRQSLPAGHPEVAVSLNNLGMLLVTRTQLDEAESLLREALDIRRRTLDAAHPDVALSLGNLASLLVRQSRGDEAAVLFREALQLQRTALGAQHPDVAKTLLNLARVLYERGDYEEADRVAEDALPVLRRVFGEQHPNVAGALHNIAVWHLTFGDAAGAEPPLREALAIFEKIGGHEHPSAAHCRDSLALVLITLERFDEAIALLEEALAQRRKAFGERDDKVGLTLGKLAQARLRNGDLSGARAAAESGIDILRPQTGLRADLAMALLTLAEAQLAENDFSEASGAGLAAIIAEARGIFQERFGETSWQAANAECVDGLYRVRIGCFNEAEAALLHAFQILDVETVMDPRRRQARDRTRHALVQLYGVWGKPEHLARWTAQD